MNMQRNFSIGTNILLITILSSIAAYSPFLLNDKLFATGLVLLILLIVLYYTLSFLFNTFNLYIFSSVFLVIIGTKIHFNKNEEYIGGIGASDLYLGVPHLTLLLGVITLVVFSIKNPNKTLKLNIDKYDVILASFIILCTISSIIAPYKQASFNQLNLYVTLFLDYKIWKTIFSNLEKNKLTKIIINSFFVCILSQIIIVALQVAVGGELGLNFIGEGTVPERLGTSFPSVTGTFGHPGPLSLFLTISASILFPYFLTKKYKLAAIGFVLSLLGIVITFSRTSILVVVVVILFNWLILNKKYKRYISKQRVILICGVASIFVFVFGSVILGRFLSLTNNAADPQINNRWTHYIMAWDYIKANPIIGYGLNNWAYTTKTSFNSSGHIYGQFFYDNPAHNLYLLFWYEGGIFLLVTFLILMVTTIIQAIKDKINIMNVGIGCGLISILIYSCVGWGLVSGAQLLYTLFLVLAICHAQLKRQSKDI